LEIQEKIPPTPGEHEELARDEIDVNVGNFHMFKISGWSRFSHLAGGAWASGSPLGQLGFSQLQAAGTAVKIQAMRIGLPTTHQSPSPQRGEVYFRGSPSLGQVRSLVDYSLQNSSTTRKGKKRKKPLYM